MTWKELAFDIVVVIWIFFASVKIRQLEYDVEELKAKEQK